MKELRETDKLLTNIKRVHMIGIGGSGMCPLAEILHSKGYVLTGSDNNEGDTLNRVKSLGIKVFMGHDASNIEGAVSIPGWGTETPCAAQRKKKKKSMVT